METKIQVIVSMDVPAGALSGLREMIPSINDVVKTGEPETLLYRWYISEDESKCQLHESFPSEEAFAAHLKNVEPVLNDLFSLAPISGWDIFGNVSAELMEGLKAFGRSQNITPTFNRYLSGFVRQSNALPTKAS